MFHVSTQECIENTGVFFKLTSVNAFVEGCALLLLVIKVKVLFILVFGIPRRQISLPMNVGLFSMHLYSFLLMKISCLTQMPTKKATSFLLNARNKNIQCMSH